MNTDIRIVSGGQTGADRAALDFAIDHRIPHGGWCPSGRRAEDGPISIRYRLRETPSADYLQRTDWNVRDTDATVIFTLAPELSGGSTKTAELAQKHRKPWLHLSPSHRNPSERLKKFIQTHGVALLNVAGTRASKEPAIGDFVRATLQQALQGAASTRWLQPGRLSSQPAGAQNRALNSGKNAARAATSAERLFRKLERCSAKAFRDCVFGGSLDKWKALRASNLHRALRLADSRLPEREYASLAFSQTTTTLQAQVLHGFVNRRPGSKRYWPIVWELLVGLADHALEPQAFHHLNSDALVAAYRKLTRSQKEVVRSSVAEWFLMRHCMPLGVFQHLVLPGLWDRAPSAQGSIADFARQWDEGLVLRVMRETVGTLSFYFCASGYAEFQSVPLIFGANPAHFFHVTLDFKTAALPDHRAFSHCSLAPLPKPRQVRKAEQFYASTRLKPPRAEPVHDYLASVFWDGPVGPQIVLRMQRVADLARTLRIAPDKLCALAWVHALAHLIHLGVPDEQGRFNAPVSPAFREAVARWATDRALARDGNLRELHHVLTETSLMSPGRTLPQMDVDDFRWRLWRLRSEKGSRRLLAQRLFGGGKP